MKVTLMATFVVAKIQKKQLLCKLNCKNRYYLRRNIFEEEAEKTSPDKQTSRSGEYRL